MANPLPHIFQQLSIQGPMSYLDDNFNALIGNVQAGAYMLAQDIGAANAYAATITPAPVTYQTGMIIVLQNIIAANTGASTFNLNGLGALPILKSANNALTGGEVVPGSFAVLALNGATGAWHLIYASANFNPGPNSVFSSGSQFHGASTFDTMPQVDGAPIVENGSNANGSYTKWADGTMVCSKIIVVVSSGFNSFSAYGSLYNFSTNGPGAFPATFIAQPMCLSRLQGTGGGTPWMTFYGVATTTTFPASIFITAPVNFTFSSDVNGEFFAIGRWK